MFLIIRPEALVRGMEERILEFLERHDFGLLDVWTCLSATSKHFEELYKYNLADATEAGRPASWWLDSLSFLRLKELKGPADPDRTVPGQLRHEFQVDNYSLALVHSADDSLSTAREFLIFHPIERLRARLRTSIRNLESATARDRHAEAMRQRRLVELAAYSYSPQFATDLVSAFIRVKIRLLKMLPRPSSEPSIDMPEIYLQFARLASAPGPSSDRMQQYVTLCRRELQMLEGQWSSGSVGQELLVSLARPEAYDLSLAETIVAHLRGHAVYLSDWERTVLLTGMTYPRTGARSGR
ncbi:MAG: hypothetical protein E6K80_08190 [Candidatus Eisenbacteria bacterium]|uniref:Nucleoside diphosphate kinase-like domain-containing protein n=1 Tax=Eiseniibacteriota bacterium TaxID=2212470 RepID=A0A538U3S1_UNCEI|nr:MAG: hypothetical protein E6K80_08190 [Candidatus Eisenbacteria bacterium]